ncbi:MAG: glycosyltransferase [Verrucomicrobiota bacterium]
MVLSTLERSRSWKKGDATLWRRQASPLQRINLLLSDTGGGHRACAQALRDALLAQNPSLDVQLVDGLRATQRFPIDRMPEIYTRWSGKRNLWRTTFHLTNGRRLFNALLYPWQMVSAPQLREAIVGNDPDLIITMHPCLTAAAVHFARKSPSRPRVSTVVTDLFYGHASWFQHGADAYFVPTEAIARQAKRLGIPERRIHLTGLPLAPRIGRLTHDREALRATLGYTRPTVVCVGGADGMGIQRIAPALSSLPPSIDVHIVCGKNEALKEELESRNLPAHIHVHGFTRNLPEMLAGADLALIKASPTVLMEALSVGTYVLLFDYVPGQESANVRFVRRHGLGDYSRSPRTLAAKIRRLLSRGERPTPPSLANIIELNGAETLARHLLAESQPSPPHARHSLITSNGPEPLLGDH